MRCLKYSALNTKVLNYINIFDLLKVLYFTWCSGRVGRSCSISGTRHVNTYFRKTHISQVWWYFRVQNAKTKVPCWWRSFFTVRKAWTSLLRGIYDDQHTNLNKYVLVIQCILDNCPIQKVIKTISTVKIWVTSWCFFFTRIQNYANTTTTKMSKTHNN